MICLAPLLPWPLRLLRAAPETATTLRSRLRQDCCPPRLDSREAANGEVSAAIERLERVVSERPQPAALTLLADLDRLAGDEEAAAVAQELERTVARLQETAGQP